MFGEHLALLVREFQIEASQSLVYSRIAADWDSRNAYRRYRGRITGHLDRDTRRTLHLWLNRPDFPVPNRTDAPPELQAATGQMQVTNALTVFQADPANHTQNVRGDLWWWDDNTDSGRWVFARDRLQRYPIPAGPPGEVLPGDLRGEVVALGRWTDNREHATSPKTQPIGGPVLNRDEGSWKSVGFTMADLQAGGQFPAPGAADRAAAESTFALIYAMSTRSSLGGWTSTTRGTGPGCRSGCATGPTR